MGTRADYFIGEGESAEWLGSTAWDGYPEGVAESILKATTEEEFRAAVSAELTSRDDGTVPENGWPWPWDDSRTTDYAYMFVDGKVWASYFGRPLFDPLPDVLPTLKDPNSSMEETMRTAYTEQWWGAYDHLPKISFPDMKDKKNIALDGRSGLIILSA
jgi:hypothetical protein